ncbi:MAG: hypothetical protein JSW27_25395 [Phycisphaerales bacterium]|nr:MAG: hypothetical protein JSW27_25395 [Phycisphaerales bacterium]
MCRKMTRLIYLTLVIALLGGDAVSGGIVIERRISSGTDDVEERPDGSIDVTSSDLEMPYENSGPSSPQVIGLRFQDVAVASDAIITAAWLQFEVDETKDDQPVNLLIEGQLSPNPDTFSDELNSVTSRPRTQANATWSVPVWSEVSVQGPDQRSVDLTAIIQEIIGQEGWASGNAIVLIISDDPDNPSQGVRTAESYSLPSGAPLLHIEIFGTAAAGPIPADGAVGVMPTALAWAPGDTAVSHDVYFGTSPTLVPDDFQGRQEQATFALDESLTAGETYYWRIDEVEADGVTIHAGAVWSFTVATVLASSPLPPHGAKWIDNEADLAWAPGLGAVTHDVYFGTDRAAVVEGTGETYKGTQEGTSFDPGTLEENATYYWRIDEMEADGITPHHGDVWRFTTAGPGGGIKGRYYHYSGGAPPNPPEEAFEELVMTRVDAQIDFEWSEAPGAGMNADRFAVKWTGELEVAFSEPYRFITTTDDGLKLWIDGRLAIDNWTLHGTTVDTSDAIVLKAGPGHTLEMWWFENNGGAVAQLSWESPSTPQQPIPQGALSEPLRAWPLYPLNRMANVGQTTRLRWVPGDKAVQHDVFFGHDVASVTGADAATAGIYRGRQAGDATTYDPGTLEANTTYYWRIDEIDESDPNSPWTGWVWSFTTADYIVLDDFERYTDDQDAEETIFDTWIDGWTNGTGSLVGHLDAPFAEQTIVHSGRQSMPFGYDNSNPPYYSEAERAWTTPQDWTAREGTMLTLFIRGSAGNTEDDLYLMVEDTAGNTALAVLPGATLASEWAKWSLPLAGLSATGVDATAVTKICLGVGDRTNPAAGGAGQIFIDDIRVDGMGLINGASDWLLASTRAVTPVSPWFPGRPGRWP